MGWGDPGAEAVGGAFEKYIGVDERCVKDSIGLMHIDY